MQRRHPASPPVQRHPRIRQGFDGAVAASRRRPRPRDSRPATSAVRSRSAPSIRHGRRQRSRSPATARRSSSRPAWPTALTRRERPTSGATGRARMRRSSSGGTLGAIARSFASAESSERGPSSTAEFMESERGTCGSCRPSTPNRSCSTPTPVTPRSPAWCRASPFTRARSRGRHLTPARRTRLTAALCARPRLGAGGRGGTGCAEGRAVAAVVARHGARVLRGDLLGRSLERRATRLPRQCPCRRRSRRDGSTRPAGRPCRCCC